MRILWQLCTVRSIVSSQHLNIRGSSSVGSFYRVLSFFFGILYFSFRAFYFFSGVSLSSSSPLLPNFPSSSKPPHLLQLPPHYSRFLKQLAILLLVSYRTSVISISILIIIFGMHSAWEKEDLRLSPRLALACSDVRTNSTLFIAWPQRWSIPLNETQSFKNQAQRDLEEEVRDRPNDTC